MRQNPPTASPRGGRSLPWPFKVSKDEMAALQTVSQVRGVEPQDLIRDHSLNDIVSEYRRLIAQSAAAS